MVSFNSIAPYWKPPGVNIEVDPSQAGTPVNLKFANLVAIAKGGVAPMDIPVAVGTQADADYFFGPGSMAANMFRVFFTLNRSQVLFITPIAEPVAGVAATGTITVTAAPTVAGTLALYVGSKKVPVGIGSADTTAQVATKIAAAINADTTLPVTATSSTATVTVTCKWKGIDGNDIRMEVNYRTFYGGEYLPTTLALTIANSGFLTGGTGIPDFTTAIANFGDQPYKFIGLPWSDSGTYSVFDTEFGFSDSGRWGWIRQVYGQIFSARRGIYSALFSYGPTNNSPVISTLAIENTAPSPVYEWVAAYTAQAAKGFTNDPARPLQTLALTGILPARREARFNLTQLNGLATVGLAIQGTDVYSYAGSGIPMILREQSNYQRNTLGLADNAYELMTTLATLDEIFTRLRQSITNKFPRHKLANNGTRFAPGQDVVTPNIIKAELISEYAGMEFDALVENRQAFKDNLIVVRSSIEPNSVDVLYPPDLVNQLRRFNVRAQFRLQFPT
jgi:phage tail sheath gpL-like